MILYVVRHADAVDANDTLQDEWRYLTEKGRSAAKKMSSKISKLGPKTRLTITSPLTRAVQTAEIAAEKACRKNVVVASSLLLPGADITELMKFIHGSAESKRVMVVGHEPQLASLAATLLGYTDRSLSLKKGSCLTLELDPENADKPADFMWYLEPGKKRIMSFKKAFPAELP
jgi:phosphohistidine phosphatase